MLQIISNPNEGWKADHQKAAEKSAAWAASGNVDTPDYFDDTKVRAQNIAGGVVECINRPPTNPLLEPVNWFFVVSVNSTSPPECSSFDS